jgi:acetyltransferase-like isoleucine patch superfamily enzyme
MKRGLRLCATALAALLPRPFGPAALNLLGHSVGGRARIGFSLVLADRLVLQDGARIGHLNLLMMRRLVMRSGARMGRRNVVHGPVSIAMGEHALIGNRNKVLRAPQGSVCPGPALFRLGELAGITGDHRVDCTRSVRMDDFSTVAGAGTQIWTHGYVHDQEGPGRYRIDGRVRIGRNVYVGSACVVTAGVSIADGAVVGAGATVARSLSEPGLYVSAGLRRLERPPSPDQRTDLTVVEDEALSERVYVKRTNA